MHFDGGGDPRTEGLKVINQLPSMPPDTNMPLMQYLNTPEGREYLKNKELARKAIINNTNGLPDIEKMQLGPMSMLRRQSNVGNVLKSVPPSSDAEDAELGVAMQTNKITSPVPTPAVGAKPLTGIGGLNTPTTPKAPAAPTVPAAPVAPAVLSDEENLARINKLKAMTGVSNDPYADIKERYAKIENTRNENAKQDPYNRAMALLSGFVQAGYEAPEKGFGYAVHGGSTAHTKLEKEQIAFRDKEALEMAGIQKAFAQEEDARRRGDMAGVEAARKDQQAHQTKLQELAIQKQTADAQTMKALADRAMANKPSQYSEMVALAKNNPELFKLMQGVNKSGAMTKEEAYKAVSGDFRNMGLTDIQLRQKADDLYKYANNIGAEKITTMEEIEATAKQAGVSVEQAKQKALAYGYKIQ